jgi:uncharacterized membrane protein
MRVNDVPFREGPVWIKQAFAMFTAQPMSWLALMFAWLLVTLLLGVVPLVGGPLATIAQTAFFAGFMLACRDQQEGKTIGVGHLVAALQINPRALILVGSVALLAHTAVTMLVVALGFRVDPLVEILRLPAPELQNAIKTGALAAQVEKLMPLTLLAHALSALITAVLWFVAPLLAFHPDMKPTHAIRWSIYALVTNAGAMLVFGVLMMLLFVMGMLPLGLGLILAIPIFMIGNYTSYRATFGNS